MGVNSPDWERISDSHLALENQQENWIKYLSSSQPYAFGVSFITVCKGILIYGRSA